MNRTYCFQSITVKLDDNRTSSNSANVDTGAGTRVYGRILALLTLLFFLRVLGQILVGFFSVTSLPAMEHWHSGLIPYPVLLAIQVVMLAFMTKISTDISRGGGRFAKTRPNWSRFLVSFSAVYAGAMALRYVLTMIFRPEMRWFGGVIPIFFHFVLATFLYVWGRFHSEREIFARDGRAC